MTKLCLSSCDLSNIDFVSVLEELENLDVSDNKIGSIPDSKSLQKINISKNDTLINEFHALDLELGNCPSLQHLVVGSDRMKHVNFSILQTAYVEVLPPYEKGLVLPPKSALTDKSVLEKYLKSPETFITLGNQPEALNWLLKHSDHNFTTLNLSNQNLRNESDCLLDLMSARNILGIDTLFLVNCGLTELPNIKTLSSLQTLNLDDNNIENICSLTNSSLKSISLRGNPIPEISFTKENCPCLDQITCGSPSTRYIHTDVLRLYAANEINEINIPKQFKQHVLIPLHSILDSREDVKQYLESTEFQMSWYRNISDNDIVKTLELVLDNDCRVIELFVMSNEPNMYTRIGHAGLERLLTHKALQGVTRAVFDDCNLIDIPNVATLKNLDHLEMSGNTNLGYRIADMNLNVKKLILANCGLIKMPVYCLSSVEYLDVSWNQIKSIKGTFRAKQLKHLKIEGNPITELEIRSYYFPCLERIEIESKDIQHIGFELLRKMEVVYGYAPLEIKIVGDGVPNLVFPPEHILTDGSLEDFIKRPYSYIREVKRDLKTRVLVWVLDNYERSFQEFSCEGFEEVIRTFTAGAFENLIKNHVCLHSVEKLDLSNCGLRECPNLQSLRCLKELNLDNNEVTTLTGLENNYNLRKLSVVNNRIQAVDLDLSSLKCLTLGSDSTNFVGMKLLWAKLAGTLEEINVIEQHRKHLLFPSHEFLQDNIKLKAFLTNPIQDILTYGETTLRRQAVVWLLTTNQHNFTELDLSDQGELFSTMSEGNIADILQSDCLQNTKYLCLKNCNLQKLPKFKLFPSLESLDISDNHLESLELISDNESQLKSLIITGNPLGRIEVDVTNLPNLEVLECGSVSTKYISIPILERYMKGMKLEIPVQYRKSLLLPSYNIIEDDLVAEFVANPENYSNQISGLADSVDILMWFFTSRKDQESFRITDQKDLCRKQSVLRNLLHEPNLANIKKLFLDNCALTFLPNVTHLESLEVLDISYNAISDLDYKNLPSCIKELNMTGNPIEVISVDPEVLESWQIGDTREDAVIIRCGSKYTKFISFELLKLVQTDELQIEVKSAFRDTLLMPPYSILTSPSLGQFIVNPDHYLNVVKETKDMQDILEWLFRTENIELETTFALSNPLCSGLDVVSYFNDNSFKKVRTLSLRCGLTNPPNLSHLLQLTSHLVTLDVSGNRITDLCTWSCELPWLGTLQIDNNPIEVIDFNLKLFPCLTHLKWGSKETKYMRPSLLTSLVQQRVNIEVSTEANSFLFPGRHYINQGFAELSAICENPEKAIDAISDIDQKVEFLEWLLNEDLEFKSFSLSGRPELLNSQSNRKSLNILDKWKLYNIESLVLNGCNLNEIPNLKHFSKLKHLDLSNNDITSIPNLPKHEHLETLILTGNPIETVDSDFQFFPALSRLEVGSQKTYFLGMSLLKRVAPEELDTDLLSYLR